MGVYSRPGFAELAVHPGMSIKPESKRTTSHLNKLNEFETKKKKKKKNPQNDVVISNLRP